MTNDWTDDPDGDDEAITVESAAYQRARKRRRTTITLLALLVVLLGTYYYASSYWRNPSTPAASATCTPSVPATGPVLPQQVRVTVYNATKRSGLAAIVTKPLKDRGFVVGSPANDPAKRTIQQSAEVRFGPAGERAAQLVLAQVPGAVPVPDQARTDATVDLVIGEGFQSLAPAASATGAATAVPGGC